ncbi:MAG: protealysin inhibitor emfourin [Acidobacteriota bacterium]
MKIVLKSSGGIGGLRLEGEVDTSDLPSELAQRTKQHLSSKSLQAATSSRRQLMPMPDARQYEIHLLPEQESGSVERHVVDDLCPVGEVLDVIDDLLAEVVARRRQVEED